MESSEMVIFGSIGLVAVALIIAAVWRMELIASLGKFLQITFRPPAPGPEKQARTSKGKRKRPTRRRRQSALDHRDKGKGPEVQRDRQSLRR